MTAFAAFLATHWRGAVLVGACLVGMALYQFGKHEGRQSKITEQLREDMKAEKERGKDDENLRGLSDFDFCVLALRRRGLPVDQCVELRGMATE